MKRKLRPVEEEVENFMPMILFEIVWYVSLIRQLILTRNMSVMFFLVVGLMPAYTLYMNIQSAIFYRQKRKEAIAYHDVCHGRIVGVTQEIETRPTKRRYATIKRYCLTVELISPVTGAAYEIKSEPYRLPLHHYISSPNVLVYTSQSGWKYYIEDIQLKENKNDPDIFEYREEFDEDNKRQTFHKWIYMILLILFLLNILF